MTDQVLQDLERGLLTITINRPDRRNALLVDTISSLLAAVQRAKRDREVRAVLLRGAGGIFCVGGDVKDLAERSAKGLTFEDRMVGMQGGIELARLVHEMPKPVVAAVEGAAAGAGFSLALACDFRVVGENAKITSAFAKVAVSGDFGASYYLAKMVGSAKARDILLLSPVLSGREAYELGLMSRIEPDEAVLDSARELALSLARGPTIALGNLKRNINAAGANSLAAYLEIEAMHFCRTLQSDDHREAAKAFVEKRPPQFTGI